MTFADYTAFRVAVQHLIEGDDTIQGTFSTATLDLLIGLGENRVYRDLRASCMLHTANATVTGNLAPLPADLIELHKVTYSGNNLEILPQDRLEEFLQASICGDVRYAAQSADSLEFAPSIADAQSVSLTYYRNPGALKDSFAGAVAFVRYPELFMFASLAESSPFIGEDDRLPMWEAKYQRVLGDANRMESARAYGGSRLRMRVR